VAVKWRQHWSYAECSAKNAVGSVVTYDYDAFGNLIHSTGTTYNNYLFAGEQFDPDLNLYFNRARYLGTNTGRFSTVDNYEGNEFEPLSLHKYVYSSNDPIDESDPSGRSATNSTEAVGTAAIGESLDANVASYINTLELLNKAYFSAKVLLVSVALVAAIVATDILLDNKDDDDGVKRRGRIGIQGNDVKKRIKTLGNSAPSFQYQLDPGQVGGFTVSASNDTLAWGWYRTWPVLKAEGNAALSLLQVQVGQNGLACRKRALAKAFNAIASGPLSAGYSQDWQGENAPYCDGTERVDLHVFQGTAFEK
jgi:RHS repeat-associated protein